MLFRSVVAADQSPRNLGSLAFLDVDPAGTVWIGAQTGFGSAGYVGRVFPLGLSATAWGGSQVLFGLGPIARTSRGVIVASFPDLGGVSGNGIPPRAAVLRADGSGAPTFESLTTPETGPVVGTTIETLGDGRNVLAWFGGTGPNQQQLVIGRPTGLSTAPLQLCSAYDTPKLAGGNRRAIAICDDPEGGVFAWSIR